MESSKPRARNNRKRKTQRKAATVQLFKPVPLIHRVRLTARNYDQASLATSPLYFRFGLLEPLGIAPTFEAIHFQLYRRARIYAASITLKLINSAAEPVEMITNVMPFNWISGSPAISELIGKQGCKRAIVSGVGGMDRATITNKWTSAKVLGRQFALADFDFNYGQAASSTPIDIEEPAITLALTAINSTNVISYKLEYVLEYDYEFYDQYVV
jgi:hypothetical protein